MKVKNPKLLILSIILSFAPGLAGSLFTASAIPSWYDTLVRPQISPPNWIFGPVWTTLYFLMGISLYLIWISKDKNKKLLIKLFVIQLVLNGLWSIIFFGSKNLGLALAEIILLDLIVLGVIYLFYQINKLAAYLLVPYCVWILFATYLNYQFWILN